MITAPTPSKPYSEVKLIAKRQVEDDETFDICVSNIHEFFANGINVKNCMGSFHPHGNSGIEGANVRLASGTPNALIDGHGGWGTYNGDAAAARYNECRPAKLTDTIYLDPYYLRGMDLIKNFDGTRDEPVVLPAKLPMVLAIEQQGVAVGVTTHIPAFTIESLLEVTKKMLKDGKVPSDKYLAKTLQFASRWGGKVVSTPSEILEFIKTGYGPIEWICDYKIEGETIVVSGIPPSFNYDNRLESIGELDGVVYAQDQADKKHPVRMVIKIKRSDDETEARVLAKIKKILSNRITYRVNVVRRSLNTKTIPTSVQSELLAMSIGEVLEEWLDWRLEYLEVAALEAEDRVHVDRLRHLHLMRKAIDNLAIIFELLKKKGIDKAKELAKRIKITEDEAKVIWGIAVGRLDRLSAQDVDDEIADIGRMRKQIKRDFDDLGASALRRGSLNV